MVRAFLPKAALLLVLIVLLATPVVQAAEPGAYESAVTNMLPGLPDMFADAWEVLARAWAANGCRIDPNGLCLTGHNASADEDNGCRIDPNGGCDR